MTITLADVVGAGIPDSTATMAREYLFTNLTNILPADTANGSPLGVFYDAPDEDEPDDMVVVGDVELTYEPGSMVGNAGAGWLRERYTVDVTVDVYRGGNNPQMTYARAQYLTDLVCALVRYDVTFGTAENVRPDPQIITAKPATSHISTEWDDDHKGRHSVSVIQISIFAQR